MVLLLHPLDAQETPGNPSALDDKEKEPVSKTFRPDSKHSIHVELAGRTFIWGSASYEYRLAEPFAIGAGLGILSILSGPITRNNNGSSETGNYLDMATSQMIYANYFIGKGYHKLYFTGGLTNFLFTYRNTYPSETVLLRESQLEWNAGIGYQLSLRKTYLRLTAYIITLSDSSPWFPEYLPWLGLSTGFRI